jgi:hypothetical protein
MARDTILLLIAIALAVPLSVVANLLTPRLRDWWSQSSKKRLKDRIAELESALKATPLSFQEGTITIARHLASGLSCITVLVTFALGQMLFGSKGSENTVFAISLIFYSFALVQFGIIVVKATRYLKKLPDSRAQHKMRRRIENLKKNLAQKKF